MASFIITAAVALLFGQAAALSGRHNVALRFMERQGLNGPCDPPADCGEALFLTPIIRSGNLTRARAVSCVSLDGFSFPSHSGYLTVNATTNNNLFFWSVSVLRFVVYILVQVLSGTEWRRQSSADSLASSEANSIVA